MGRAIGRNKKRGSSGGKDTGGSGGASPRKGSAPASGRTSNATEYLCSLVLIISILACYSPTFYAKEGVWDDELIFNSDEPKNPAAQISNPSALSGLKSLWFSASQMREIHYWPATYTSFLFEFWLHGLQPRLCHVTNVILHIANAYLVRRILPHLNVDAWAAWLASFIFALHPMNVESTAWIIERKDTLSGLFYLSSLVTNPNIRVSQTESRSSSVMSLFLFTLAMLSKTSTVTLPAVLLLVPWAMRGQIKTSEVKGAVPFFIVGLSMAAYDVSVARKGEPVDFGFTLDQRILIASRCVVFYLSKLLYPGTLLVIYPRWNVKEEMELWALCFIGVVALLLGLFALRSRIGRLPISSLLFFGGTLFPVLGFLDYGFMEYSFVAERFQYLACLGPITCVSVGVGKLGGRFCGKDKTKWLSLNAAVFGLLAILATQTKSHAQIYQSQEYFWSYVVGVNPLARSARLNLANEMNRQERWSEAVPLYEQSLEMKPDEPKAMVNIAIGLEKLKRYDEAVGHLEKLIAIQPNHLKALNGLGNILSGQGRHDKAERYFQTVRSLDPSNTIAGLNLGNELARQNKLEEAVGIYKSTLRIKPAYTKCRLSLAAVLGMLKREVESIAQYRQVLVHDPDNQRAKKAIAEFESREI